MHARQIASQRKSPPAFGFGGKGGRDVTAAPGNFIPPSSTPGPGWYEPTSGARGTVGSPSTISQVGSHPKPTPPVWRLGGSGRDSTHRSFLALANPNSPGPGEYNPAL